MTRRPNAAPLLLLPSAVSTSSCITGIGLQVVGHASESLLTTLPGGWRLRSLGRLESARQKAPFGALSCFQRLFPLSPNARRMPASPALVLRVGGSAHVALAEGRGRSPLLDHVQRLGKVSATSVRPVAIGAQ